MPTSTPTPRRWFGPWCSTWTAQRPLQRGRMPLRSALGPTGSPRTPERSCASGLRAGLSGVRTLKARATPQRFLARIQHGLTMALDADRAYTHRLTKTPDHPTWRTFWERPDPYELGELRDYLGDRLPLRIARLEAVGEGRNVTLFDGLRKWAYRARLGYSDWHLWERACRSHADALNAFASPLTTREAHQVAKSVAKWTWTNITPTAFSKIQAERGSQNGANKKIAAMDFTAEIVRYAR